MSHGLDEKQFWTVTPARYFLQMKAIAKKYEREYETAVTVAYVGAGLQRADKMPKLEKVLGKKRPKVKEKVNPKYARALAIAHFKTMGAALPARSWEETYARHNGPDH